MVRPLHVVVRLVVVRIGIDAVRSVVPGVGRPEGRADEDRAHVVVVSDAEGDTGEEWAAVQRERGVRLGSRPGRPEGRDGHEDQDRLACASHGALLR